MARPTKGLGHVDERQGDPQSKERLKWILWTLLGVRPVQEALCALGIGRTYFATLRSLVLDGSLASLQPRPCGRPPRAREATRDEIDALHRRIAELEHENARLQAQLELAQALQVQRRSRSKSHSTSIAS